MVRLVDKNGTGVRMEEDLYFCNEYQYLNIGDFIRGYKNRYRLVYKEVDITYGGGIRMIIKVIVDND